MVTDHRAGLDDGPGEDHGAHAYFRIRVDHRRRVDHGRPIRPNPFGKRLPCPVGAHTNNHPVEFQAVEKVHSPNDLGSENILTLQRRVIVENRDHPPALLLGGAHQHLAVPSGAQNHETTLHRHDHLPWLDTPNGD